MTRALRMLGSAVFVGLVGCGSESTSAQPNGETFTATASVKSAAGTQVTAPVTIVITRFTNDQERATVAEAGKKDATAGVVQSLKSMSDVGYIEVGAQRTALKYAYARPVGGGRLITVIAPTPIVHLGAGLPDAQPKAGFDLALAILEMTGPGAGSGELVPAATIKLDDRGAISTQDYGAEGVHLANVQSKK